MERVQKHRSEPPSEQDESDEHGRVHAAADYAANDPLTEAAISAKSGNQEGVRRFLQGILPLVRRVCSGVLGGGHPDLEDAVQESMLACLNALANYRFEGRIDRYVARITLRMAIAMRRRRVARWKRHESLDLQPEPSLVAEPAEWRSEDVELIRTVLDTLSPLQGEALFLRIVLDYSVEDIAAATGVSINTVKSRLKLGKNALRRGGRAPFWRRWFSAGGTS